MVFLFLLYSSYPWELRLKHEKVVGIGSGLCKMSKICHFEDYLHQLWGNLRALPSLPDAWCTECFIPHPLDISKRSVPKDFHGVTLDELGEGDRFMVARPGNHLCCSFQCPGCHSQIIQGKDLQRDHVEDQAFECMVIRATLDAFWAHQRGYSEGTCSGSQEYAEVWLVKPWTLLPYHHWGPFILGGT